MIALDTKIFFNDPWWIVAIKCIGVVVLLLTWTIVNVWYERRLVGKMQHRLGPVSYTHLDVYKRQRSRRASTARPAASCAPTSGTSRSSAVSYTHLDVYKRQHQGRRAAHELQPPARLRRRTPLGLSLIHI